jgi:hypothetical protein
MVAVNGKLHQYDSEDYDFSFDDYLVKQIDKRTAREFIQKYHYAKGSGNAIMPWGLYEQVKGRLVGVIAFQTPISENTRASIFEELQESAEKQMTPCDCGYIDGEHGYREHVTELHRMAIHPDCPQNTATWFISRALDRLKEYKPKYWAVISMADSTEGHDGTVYQAANADYYGTSKPRKFYRDQSGFLRNPRQVGENISHSEAKKRGWDIEQREAKHRYVFWLPDEYYSKDELRELATVELQQYP